MIRVLVCLALLTSFTSPAYPQQQLHIRLNQIGFPFGGVKTAVVFGGESLPTDFRVVNAHSGAPIFKGKVDPLTGGWGQFERLGQMDFTSLTVEGHYDLEVGSTRSRPFVIAAGVYHDVANHLLEFMRQQRCGYNPFVDAVCHSFDGRTAFGIGVPFIWCSNNLTVALATQVLLFERMTGDSRYRKFAAKQIDWLLGRIHGAFRCLLASPNTVFTRATCICLPTC